jgi:hypothetical protein
VRLSYAYHWRLDWPLVDLITILVFYFDERGGLLNVVIANDADGLTPAFSEIASRRPFDQQQLELYAMLAEIAPGLPAGPLDGSAARRFLVLLLGSGQIEALCRR